MKISTKKEIVYLNQAVATPPKTENGKWKIEDLVLDKPPTKCKVTINNEIVIDDVYVWENTKDGGYSLYNNYNIEKRGWGGEERENCWACFRGRSLVLEFKSENYVIENNE